jgi:glycosyltransferase involved in cell wall biosynthesis
MSISERGELSKAATVDVVIPVLNEAHVLEKSVETVRAFLKNEFPYSWKLNIVDNGSTDGTGAIAERLSRTYPDVRAILIKETGRGLALRQAWMGTDSDYSCYLDVDLSTELRLLIPLVRAVVEEGYDIAIGSRLMKGARIQRSFLREIISRQYNNFLKIVLRTNFSDAQCGFKAVTREIIQQVVPQIRNRSWFFDTEMLVLAEKQGYRIKEIPVVWVEDPDSRVKLIHTSLENIKAVFQLRWRLWNGESTRPKSHQLEKVANKSL